MTDNVKNKIAGTGGQSHRRFWEFVFVAVLVLYPLRHIAWGLDLWDTGYGYANFEYMGTRHMDPMWLFSTYLTTVIGHFFSLLPGAKTLIGMNFYTGLSISLLAVLGYYFCTKVLKIPAGLAFLGEFTAVSFCWCPTGSFYNYVTYVFFLVSVICLYLGLSRGKGGLLFAAGVALGCGHTGSSAGWKSAKALRRIVVALREMLERKIRKHEKRKQAGGFVRSCYRIPGCAWRGILLHCWYYSVTFRSAMAWMSM